MVDSGADVSVFPASASQKNLPSAKLLQAANGSSIKTFGKKKIYLSFAGLSVSHQFLLADVEKPILGSDFFRANDLLIDIAKCRLVRSCGGDLPASAVVVKARPAKFAGGLFGLRSEISSDGSPVESTASMPFKTIHEVVCGVPQCHVAEPSL